MQRQQLEEGAEEEVEGVAEAGAAVRVQWTRVQWIYFARHFFPCCNVSCQMAVVLPGSCDLVW